MTELTSKLLTLKMEGNKGPRKVKATVITAFTRQKVESRSNTGRGQQILGVLKLVLGMQQWQSTCIKSMRPRIQFQEPPPHP